MQAVAHIHAGSTHVHASWGSRLSAPVPHTRVTHTSRGSVHSDDSTAGTLTPWQCVHEAEHISTTGCHDSRPCGYCQLTAHRNSLTTQRCQNNVRAPTLCYRTQRCVCCAHIREASHSPAPSEWHALYLMTGSAVLTDAGKQKTQGHLLKRLQQTHLTLELASIWTVLMMTQASTAYVHYSCLLMMLI
jgi:hypothetical protein